MRRLTLCALLALCACGEDDPCVDAPVGYVCALAGTGQLGFNRDGLAPEDTDFYLLSAVRARPMGSSTDGLQQPAPARDRRGAGAHGDGHRLPRGGGGRRGCARLAAREPVDFDFLPDGRLVFVSYHDPRVLVLDVDGTIQRLAGTGEIGLRGNEGDYEPALDALFIQLDGIAVAPDGKIYVSDSLAHRVRVVRDGIVAPVAGNGAEELSGDGGPAIDAALHWPTALNLRSKRQPAHRRHAQHVVRRVDADGIITTIAGNGTQGFGGDGRSCHRRDARSAEWPRGRRRRTLYIADRGNFAYAA